MDLQINLVVVVEWGLFCYSFGHIRQISDVQIHAILFSATPPECHITGNMTSSPVHYTDTRLIILNIVYMMGKKSKFNQHCVHYVCTNAQGNQA